MGTYIGIDFGARRVGLATADPDVRIARPEATVSPADLQGRLAALGPFEAVVVGLPRGLDGQETAQTAAARAFVAGPLADWGYNAAMQDEAGTSSVAEDQLRATGRPYAKGDIDALAAAIILQDYLDGLS